MSRPWIQAHQMDRNVGVGLTKPHKPLKPKHSTYDGMHKVKLRGGERRLLIAASLARLALAFTGRGLFNLVSAADLLETARFETVDLNG